MKNNRNRIIIRIFRWSVQLFVSLGTDIEENDQKHNFQQVVQLIWEQHGINSWKIRINIVNIGNWEFTDKRLRLWPLPLTYLHFWNSKYMAVLHVGWILCFSTTSNWPLYIIQITQQSKALQYDVCLWSLNLSCFHHPVQFPLNKQI